MLKKGRVLLVAMLVAIPLGAASEPAAASISFTPSGSFTIVSEGSLTFESELAEVICPITLSGSLHAGSIAETAGALVGTVTAVTLGRCSGASDVRAPAELLPWHVTFGSLLGTSPEAITGVEFRLVSAALLFTISTIFGRSTCLYSGTIPYLTRLAGENPYVFNGTTILANELPLSRTLAGICPSNGTIRGNLRDALRGRILQKDPGNGRPLQAEVQKVAIIGAGSLTFTFKNTTAADITVERDRLLFGTKGIAITRHGCNGVVLRANEANTCQVTVSWTPPGAADFGDALLLMAAGQPKGQVVIAGAP